MTYIILILFLSNILLWSVGDGLNDNGRRKTLGHLLRALSFLPVLLSPFFIVTPYIGWYLASYILIRMALFDAGYNLTRGLPIAFVGTTSLWDRFWRMVSAPASWIIAAKIIFLLVGIAILFKEL